MNDLMVQNRRKSRHSKKSKNPIITRVIDIDSDPIALKKQWLLLGQKTAVALPQANLALVKKNLIEQQGWKEIESQKYLSLQGMHIVSYRYVSTVHENPVKQLLASSRLTELTSESKENGDLLYRSDFFQQKIKLHTPFNHPYDKRQICKFLHISADHWHHIHNWDDIIEHKKESTREWIRLAFCLHRKEFFNAIFTIIQDSFNLLDGLNIEYVLPIAEKNIFFHMMKVINAFAGRPIGLIMREFDVYNEITDNNIDTYIGLINIRKTTAAINAICADSPMRFWKKVRQNKKDAVRTCKS